jgi:hypothetical protein
MLCLAAARATRVITEDTIFEGARDRLQQWAWNTGRGKIADLVSCPYCAGWWLSLVTYVAWTVGTGQVHHVPWLVHAVECWAVMGGQMIVNAVDAALHGATAESFAIAEEVKE